MKSSSRPSTFCPVPSFSSASVENQANIVLLHCNAGKGRTGTAISSILMFSGMIDNAEEALKFYSHKRFKLGSSGVTQPCQVRYVRYFELALKRQIRSAPPKVFRQMVINFLPAQKCESRPYIEIYQYHFQNLVSLPSSLRYRSRRFIRRR
ncbi:MAG: hypothetical protein P4M11_14895 [Candidatus Pacebacteria bacterium]|nr:hypothetical protein [Candidatus Paceibacterota bacterium]